MSWWGWILVILGCVVPGAFSQFIILSAYHYESLWYYTGPRRRP